MICVVHSYEIVPGKDWQDAVALCKKIFLREKETYGQQVFFMQKLTGKRDNIVVAGFYESQAAHEEYVKKLGEDTAHQDLMKQAKRRETVVPGSLETHYYNVIE